jgi:CubicO group peptidase (beta-lactamase class C family)
MLVSRRGFTTGALSFALGSQLAAPAFAQGHADLSAALAAIRAYGEAHRAYFNLPGMTLGLTSPDGFGTTLNFGYANEDARTAIRDDTLFQIGSITKSMVAMLIHLNAAEGRFALTDRISALLPMVPLPKGDAITLQHLLDHSAGLADGPPVFAQGGLWTGFAPGTHWSYSNTGYVILGMLAEHVGGKPLDRLLAERIFAPLGMGVSRGAIVGADRPRYAQGYEAADETVPFARGTPLAPAAWVDVTDGAGCVASTAGDMVRWLRTLASAAQGKGALGLSPQQARIFAGHAVPSDTPTMAYGNGLMHVGGGRAYLHHTGGMVSFSSSFHVDVASGVGAFASSTLSAFAEYRPRLLTRFAVDALTSAMTGRRLPQPPPLETRLSKPSDYIGRYSGPSGEFEVRAGAPLTIVVAGQSAELQPWDGELFRTTHPAFREFSLLFERRGGAVVGAAWGPASYVRAGAAARIAPSDPAVARLAGRYINDSPWLGAARVVERGGKLWLGTEMPMQRIGENLWRIGDQPWSPERGSFADFVDGRPRTFVYSAEKFLRHDV